MRALISLCLLLLLQQAYTQQVIDVSKQDVNISPNLFYSVGGEPFVNAKFVNLVEGSPYFTDEWLQAVLVDEANQQYKNVSIKLDLLDKSIHFLDSNGKEFIATTPVKEIVLTDSGGNNFRFVRSTSLGQPARIMKESWLLCLSSGTASLYKLYSKTLSEQRPYGSATTEQRIRTAEKYFLLHNNRLTEVKKIKDVTDLLADRKKELEAFLKTSGNGKASMDDRLASVIEYYNTITKGKEITD